MEGQGFKMNKHREKSRGRVDLPRGQPVPHLQEGGVDLIVL